MATRDKFGRLKSGSIEIDVCSYEGVDDTYSYYRKLGITSPICVIIKTSTHIAIFAIAREQANELVRLLYKQNTIDMVRFTSAQHEEFAISWTHNYSLRFIFKGTKETLTHVLTITKESAQVLLNKLNAVLSSNTVATTNFTTTPHNQTLTPRSRVLISVLLTKDQQYPIGVSLSPSLQSQHSSMFFKLSLTQASALAVFLSQNQSRFFGFTSSEGEYCAEFGVDKSVVIVNRNTGDCTFLSQKHLAELRDALNLTMKQSTESTKECPDCRGKKRILLLNSFVPCDCIKGK